MSVNQELNFTQLSEDIKLWGKALGFQQVAISDTQLDQADAKLQAWLAKKYHGSMEYLARHREKRLYPQQLVEHTVRIIMVRMNYLTQERHSSSSALANKNQAYISRYALGRDYHKLMRKRLRALAAKINSVITPFHYRAFVDSAPVFEKPLAEKAGLGWMGKNTLILNREAGSWFFLGALFINIPLPVDQPVTEHCGSCQACIDVCPTKAIVAPYVLDARRCISYLTIENKGNIPIEFRSLIGNRIFGCDDCQLFCPWNKYAQLTAETDFSPRHGLATASLIELFLWDEATFLRNTEGSALRRAGYFGWLRNIAVALGNAPPSAAAREVLAQRLDHGSPLVREHVEWALIQHHKIQVETS